MICLSKYVYETQDLILMGVFGFILLASFVFTGVMIYGVFAEYRELKDTRWGLTRRDIVIYMGKEWEVWTNHHNGYVTVRAFPERLYYKRVRLEEVYPVPEKPEIEIVNES